MGVPLEWNLVMIYGAWVLFGVHGSVAIASIADPALWGWLVAFHVVLPLYGSLVPRHVSFLLSMRYYAGNWAYGVWLFRGDSVDRLDRLTKASPGVRQQLGLLYDDDTIDALLSKVMAFRAMHLQGRALRHLLPRAVDDIDAYTWMDGEVVAGLALGWNFGEGHLSNERLLSRIQAVCGFAPGELRCIFVESQPNPSAPGRLAHRRRRHRTRGRRHAADRDPAPGSALGLGSPRLAVGAPVADRDPLAGLDLNLLRVLDVLLVQQSTTRAAAVLGLTQSAVSRAPGAPAGAARRSDPGAVRQRHGAHRHGRGPRGRGPHRAVGSAGRTAVRRLLRSRHRGTGLHDLVGGSG